MKYGISPNNLQYTVQPPLTLQTRHQTNKVLNLVSEGEWDIKVLCIGFQYYIMLPQDEFQSIVTKTLDVVMICDIMK